MVKLTKIIDVVKDKKGSKNLKWKLKFKHEPNNFECQHCIYEQRENSIPQDEFIIKNEKGNDKIINEIRVKRGSDEDVVGWIF